jgi:hypothetical protein
VLIFGAGLRSFRPTLEDRQMLDAGPGGGDRGTSDNLTSHDLPARLGDLRPACHVRREFQPVRPAAPESGVTSPTFFRAA